MAPGRRSLAGRESRARAPPCSRVKAREGMDLLVAAGGDAVVCFSLAVSWWRAGTDRVSSRDPRGSGLGYFHLGGCCVLSFVACVQGKRPGPPSR